MIEVSCIQSHLRVLHYIDVLQHSRGNNKFKTCKKKTYLIRKHKAIILLDCREEIKVDWTCISNKSNIPRNSWYQMLLVSQYLAKRTSFTFSAYNKIHSNYDNLQSFFALIAGHVSKILISLTTYYWPCTNNIMCIPKSNIGKLCTPLYWIKPFLLCYVCNNGKHIVHLWQSLQ